MAGRAATSRSRARLGVPAMMMASGGYTGRGAVDTDTRVTRTRVLAFTPPLTPAQITADQNDYNPPQGTEYGLWRIASDAARNITGILAPASGSNQEGRTLILRNIGSFTITLVDASIASSAANRFAFPAGNLDVAPLDGIILDYDPVSSRWFVLGDPVGPAEITTTDADYLVGTAHAGLSAEIVVGTTPGGELGGTWAAPTVDGTHSGSAHHASVSLAASADVLLGLTGQELNFDTQLANVVLAGPASGVAVVPTFRALVSADLPAAVVETTDANWIDLTDGGSTTLHSHAGGGAVEVQTFNTAGANTWTKPASGTLAYVECWGGGGSGARGATTDGSGGGGGGGYKWGIFLLSALGATETATVAAGGASRTTNLDGAVGGNSTFGAHLTAYGGGGGGTSPAAGGGGGGGGGNTAVGVSSIDEQGGAGGGPVGGASGDPPGDSAFGGGGGTSGTGTVGGASVEGGGGGGFGAEAGGASAGGTSVRGGGGGGGGGGTGSAAGGNSEVGGDGGAGATGGIAATAGSQPGGGGGGAEAGNSGAGGGGRIRITVL